MKTLQPLKLARLVFSVAALFGLAGILYSCGKQASKNNRPSTTVSTPGGSNVVFNYDGDGTVGMLHFGQIRQAMSAVTGVDPLDTQVRNYYQVARSRYSLQGNVETVSPAMLLATTALAGIYCSKLIAADKALGSNARRVFNAVDFSQNQSGLTMLVRQAVFQKISQVFWRRSASAEELAILNTALDEALVGRPSSTTETINAMLVVCTAALSSVDFIQD